VPEWLDGEPSVQKVIRHVLEVTGAKPNNISTQNDYKQLAIQCEALEHMELLQFLPFIWNDVVYEWRTMDGRTTYPLLIAPTKLGWKEDVENAVNSMKGDIIVPLCQHVVNGAGVDVWTITIEMGGNQKVPTELTDPQGESIALVHSAHTHHVCPDCLEVSKGPCTPCDEAAAAKEAAEKAKAARAADARKPTPTPQARNNASKAARKPHTKSKWPGQDARYKLND
ncbi:hypothetical protein IWQ56_002491, partial [Coemansia nantahalensis]